MARSLTALEHAALKARAERHRRRCEWQAYRKCMAALRESVRQALEAA